MNKLLFSCIYFDIIFENSIYNENRHPPYSKNPPSRRLSQCIADQICETNTNLTPVPSLSSSPNVKPPSAPQSKLPLESFVQRKPLKGTLYSRSESQPYSIREPIGANSQPLQAIQSITQLAIPVIQYLL